MDPLVLFHGFSGAGRAWDPVLHPLMAAGLKRQVDGWSPDLPGHGSSAGVRPGSFEATVRRLADTLARRFTRPVVLVGYSMGGRLALGLALSQPRLIRHLVLIGVQPGLSSVIERRRRADADAGLADCLLRDGLDAFVAQWQDLPLFRSQKNLPSAKLVQQRKIRMAQDPEGLAWALRVLSPGLMPDYRPALLAWNRANVTLITGGLDEKFTDIARTLGEASPSIRSVVIPGAGHNLVLERPDAVAEALAVILRQGDDP